MAMQLLNMPKRDSLLDTVMKGVSIAKDVYGLSTQVESKATAEDDKERLRSGKFYPNELAELGKFYDIGTLPTNDRGEAAIFKGGNANDPNSEFYFFFRNKKEKEEKEAKPHLARVTQTDEDGNEYDTFINPTEGARYKKPDNFPKEKVDAALFAQQAETANQIIEDLTKSGYRRGGMLESISDYGPEMLKSQNLKEMNQAEQAFTEAWLRRTSGAAVTQSEKDEARRMFFERDNDGPFVIEQKRQNRLQVIKGFKVGAGKALKSMPRVTTPVMEELHKEALKEEAIRDHAARVLEERQKHKAPKR